MKKLLHFILLFVVICAVCHTGYAQFTIPEKPDFQTSVYDYASLFSATEKTQLEEKLVRYSDTTSTQIVVATVTDLKGDSAERVAPEWAQTWGIGQKDKDNGIFILVSRDDRDMYIATGYGVQGRLTAGQVGTIIRQYIVPEFKTGDYYSGIDKGTDAIFKALNGKFKGERKQSGDGGFLGFIPFIIILIIIILAIVFRNRGGGSGGNRGFGGPDLTDILILSSLGRGSRGGSGWSGGSSGGWSGGGGFGGGFGGGGFSGGGAGGSW
ncbi:TPM domain-containing protein [Flavobacterium sp. RHBU_3]|uniref:TPM domain-containing protein n=1 Tax=Flavobacterium sp. RHBU_3 TaxID=3391184 RepID=UPI003985024F